MLFRSVLKMVRLRMAVVASQCLASWQVLKAHCTPILKMVRLRMAVVASRPGACGAHVAAGTVCAP